MKNYTVDEIKDCLQRIQRVKRLSLSALATEIGIPRGTLINFLESKRKPLTKTLWIFEDYIKENNSLIS